MAFIESLDDDFGIEANAEEDGSQWLDQVIEELVKTQPELLIHYESGKIGRKVFEQELSKLITSMKVPGSKKQNIKVLMNHMFGYGPLQKFIEDPNLSDIIMPRWDYALGISAGEEILLPIRFTSEKAFERFLKLIVTRQGGKLNEKDAHARVSDTALYLRINAVIPPRAASGPMLTIRKHRREGVGLKQLLNQTYLDETSFDLVRTIALSSKRFIICGKGAAGKTTLMRAMLSEIDRRQRIMICESDQELFPSSPSMVVQTLYGQRDAVDYVTLDRLVQDGLTMNMDGYCIGEITGKEAWSFIKAGFTDHRIMATIHAASAAEAVDRLITLSELPQTGVDEALARKMIFRSLDYVIYISKYRLMRIEALRADTGSVELVYEREGRAC